MIKRIIFDIDGTLIEWKDKYNYKVNEALDELKIKYTKEEAKKLLEAFNNYENENLIFNIENMYKFIISYTNKKYPKEIVTKVLEKWGNCVPKKIDAEIINTLEYLKEKYELVILTDWYKKPQLNRLRLLKIDKYFSKIFTSENAKRKPYKEAFLQTIEDLKPEECVMVGDSLDRDIIGAKNVKIKPIWLNKKEVKLDFECIQIRKIEDLKNIL